jgi:hypothetical protein
VIEMEVNVAADISEESKTANLKECCHVSVNVLGNKLLSRKQKLIRLLDNLELYTKRV